MVDRVLPRWAQQGSFVLVWPLWDGRWDPSFSPDVPFDGTTSEDVYLISTDDTAAVRELVRAEIERAPSREIANGVARDFFPDTRAAVGVRRAGRRARLRRVHGTERPRPEVRPSEPWAAWSGVADTQVDVGRDPESSLAVNDMSKRAEPNPWIVLVSSACAGLVLAALYVLLFVVVPTTEEDLPASVSWIFGVAFTVPLALTLCILSAAGGIAGYLATRRSVVGVAIGSLMGGGVAVALVAGVGFSVASVAFFGVSTIAQSAILVVAYMWSQDGAPSDSP